MVSDSDKHRVLPGGFGAIYIRDLQFTWDESVALDPIIEPLAPPPPLNLEHEAPIARVRFKRGNAKANVGVDRQPESEVLFECGRWALSMSDVGNVVAITRTCLKRMAVLFPARAVPLGVEAAPSTPPQRSVV